MGCGAIGQRLTKDSEDDWNTVVGVVDDFLVALIAGLAPTRRAMRVDPMTALRSE